MRKFIISAIVAAVAAVSFAAPSQAGGYGYKSYGYSKSYGHKSYGYKKSYGHKQYGYKSHSYKPYGYKKHYKAKVVINYNYGY
jgi:hypothetical protein